MSDSTKKILKAISLGGLALSVIPALLLCGGAIEKQSYLNLMLLGMLLWFGSAIFWIKQDRLG